MRKKGLQARKEDSVKTNKLTLAGVGKKMKSYKIASVLILVAIVALFAGSTSARADTVTGGCMQDIAGFGLNCTANDIRIADRKSVV